MCLKYRLKDGDEKDSCPLRTLNELDNTTCDHRAEDFKTEGRILFKPLPQYKMQMNLLQQYNFHTCNVLPVMCLITALTFSSFAVETSAKGARIQIPITISLISVAYKYDV